MNVINITAIYHTPVFEMRKTRNYTQFQRKEFINVNINQRMHEQQRWNIFNE